MARFQAPSAPKCPACGKSVYAAEEVKALGRSWHSLCFCCRACARSLRGGRYKEHDGWPYCEADHAKLFGPKGIGFGTTLGDTGIGPAPDAEAAEPASVTAPEAAKPAPAAAPAAEVRGPSPAASAEAAPAAAPAAAAREGAAAPARAQEAAPPAEGGGTAKRGSLLGGSALKCPKCGKSVFAAEEVKALGHSWHPACFCCKECGKSLRNGQYRDHQGAPYCDADYRRLFGPKGIGFGSTLGDTGAPSSASASPAPGALPEEDPARPPAAAAAPPAAAPQAAPERPPPQETAAEAQARPSLRERMAAFQKAPEAAPPPAARPAPGGGRFQANNPKCPACSKSVYAAEEVKALGGSWHALCFCCRACGKSLRRGRYKEHDGWPYCEADHNKLFGPKGIGFGTTLGDTGVGGTADVAQG
uniref:Cysteine-rich protein 1 n=1 Tax=Alexandrium monilatum TaxID=311494 RepID=A0A7S4QVK3_9DINO